MKPYGSCGCTEAPHNYPFLTQVPKLAHAYVPVQYLKRIYPPMEGLARGTIFPELDRPYGSDPEYTVDA